MANFIRKCKLTAGNLTVNGGGRQTSLRVRFRVVQKTVQSPGTISAFISNAAPQDIKTALALTENSSPVQLDAGYEDGNFGTIFKGTVRYVRVGRDNPTDTYINIQAADEVGYNFSMTNRTLPRNSTAHDVYTALMQDFGKYGVQDGFSPTKALQAIKYPRALTLFGPTKELMRKLAFTVNSTWSIQKGKMHMIPVDGSTPDDPIAINVQNGMVGMPVQTLEGIIVRSLINPQIGVNQIIKLNDSDIQRAAHNLTLAGAAQNIAISPLDPDGLYRVVMIDWSGDTHATTPWFMDIWCLSKSKGGGASAAYGQEEANAPLNLTPP